MKRLGWKATWVGLLCGGVTLVTTATCDPQTGRFDFFRDDDAGLVDVFVTDPFYDGGYYGDEIIFIDDYYYDDGYYYDDCYDCW